MTRQQFGRWAGFALRMARRGWATQAGPRSHLRPRNAKRLQAMVREWFDCLDEREIAEARDWDQTYADGMLICDRASGFLADAFEPYECCGGEHLTPEQEDQRYFRWDCVWGGRFQCCIRAGLDLACGPAVGVIGFTAGDLRRMYHGRVPRWITDPPGGWRSGPLFGDVEELGEPHSMTTMPDDQAVAM